MKKNDTILRLLEEAVVDASDRAPGKYWEPSASEILELLKEGDDAELV